MKFPLPTLALLCATATLRAQNAAPVPAAASTSAAPAAVSASAAPSTAPARAARPRPDTHGVDMRTQSGPPSARYSPPVPVDAKLPTFWLIGDSTVRNGTPGNGSTNAPDGQWGWGAPLTFYFDPVKVNVVNRALGGTSARSFYNANWKNMVDLIQKNDVVIMQFGTNDGGNPASSVGELRGIGDDTQDITNRAGQAETVHSYGWYMRQMIDQTRAKGATPIICSLVPRKSWNATGHINRATTTFAGWARQVAEAENAGFIDLNELIARQYDALGKDKVDLLYVPTPAEAAALGGNAKGETVHTGWDGAVIDAECVVSGLKALKDDPVANFFSTRGQAIPAVDANPPAPAVKSPAAAQP
jgi:lysophospholipase L1-like esterase